MILGERHLGHSAQEYVAYFNQHRAHSSLDFRSPNTRGDQLPDETDGEVLRRLGGVLNWYERRAA